MVTLKEYEAYLKVRRFIDGHDESEIILRLNIFMVRLQEKHIYNAHSLFPINIPTVSSGLKI